MVGLYGGAPLEYAGINEQGTDAVPSSTGAVLGAEFASGLAHNITPRLFRSYGRTAAAITEETDPAAERALDPETANREYGIKGHLSFDAPVPRAVAQDLAEHKQAQIEREDIIARREGGLLTGGAARFTAGMAAGILDPVNLAVGLIPVIGPAGEAALIAGAAGAAGRAAIRVGLGGAQGAVAMAALQPLEFALSKEEREDYTMAMALRSIALGGVLGGGMHAGIGGAIDRATGRYRNPITQRIEDAGPEARETLLQGALAQTIEGRPVDVAPALDAIEAARVGSGEAPGTFRTTVDINGERTIVEGPVDALRLPGDGADVAPPRSLPDATAELLSSARRDSIDPFEAQVRAEADQAAARPSETLQTIQAEIVELERGLQPPAEAAVARGLREGADTAPAGETPPAARPVPERTAADIAGELAEARAAAVERAAVCITRG